MRNSPPVAVQFSLMVEPAVGKYLKRTYPGMYLVNPRHVFGSWILHALARKNTIQRTDPDTRWFKERALALSYEFKFQVPVWCLDKLGTYIPIQSTVYLNNFILRLMYTELMMNIVFHHGLCEQPRIQDCIDRFRAKYDILEKEFPDERLRKKYLRLRRRYQDHESFVEAFNPGELLWRM